MDIKGTTREVRLARWAEILRERSDSGLSVRGYCREQRINEKTYYYWQRQLRTAVCEYGSASASPDTALSPQTSPVFAALPKPPHSGGIVVRLNGADVEIGNDASLAVVETILRVLQEC